MLEEKIFSLLPTQAKNYLSVKAIVVILPDMCISCLEFEQKNISISSPIKYGGYVCMRC